MKIGRKEEPEKKWNKTVCTHEPGGGTSEKEKKSCGEKQQREPRAETTCPFFLKYFLFYIFGKRKEEKKKSLAAPNSLCQIKLTGQKMAALAENGEKNKFKTFKKKRENSILPACRPQTISFLLFSR